MARTCTIRSDTEPSAVRRARGRSRRPPKCARRSFLTIDVVAAIGIIMVMATLFSIGVRQYSRTRHEIDACRAARAAADLELHRLRAGLARFPDDSGEARRVSDDLELQTDVRPGTGVWRDFDRVTVVARKRSRSGHWARAELSGYFLRKESRP